MIPKHCGRDVRTNQALTIEIFLNILQIIEKGSLLRLII